MSTYFNYEQNMGSKALVEAISSPKGIGPFCGFGGHALSLDGNSITLYSVPGNSTAADAPFYEKFYNIIRDRVKARNIFKNDGSTDIAHEGTTRFGCISRDGYIYTSAVDHLTLNIEGTKGIYNDVIVVAVHSPIEENVENPIEFRAFWSQSSEGFYDLYKRSLDPSYPIAKDLRDYDVDSMDPDENPNLTFNSLEEKVSGALGQDIWDSNTMCIIGIYGVGNNAMNSNALENYRIIPYDGVFPMPVPSTTAVKGLYKDIIRKLLELTSEVPNEYTSIIEYVKSLMGTPSGGGTVTTNTAAMPKGSIIMWYGTQQTIPYGWELCDGGASVNDPSITKPNLMGRVPVGLSINPGDYDAPMKIGGSENVTLKMDQMPKHDHLYTDDTNANGKYGQIESNFPRREGTYSGETSGEDDGAGCVYHTTYAGGPSGGASGSANPIDLRQPYTVLAFIIKTID